MCVRRKEINWAILVQIRSWTTLGVCPQGCARWGLFVLWCHLVVSFLLQQRGAEWLQFPRPENGISFCFIIRNWVVQTFILPSLIHFPTSTDVRLDLTSLLWAEHVACFPISLGDPWLPTSGILFSPDHKSCCDNSIYIFSTWLFSLWVWHV